MSRTRRRPPRWLAFAGVGAVGFGVQLAAIALLTQAWRMPAAVAAAVAVEIAVLHNFAWHERWTWCDRADVRPAGALLRLVRFHASAGLVSLVGNVAMTVVAVEWLHLPIIPANTCAVVALSAANFLLADRYVFRSPRWPTPSSRRSPSPHRADCD
jgi:putative flippase GtrA